MGDMDIAAFLTARYDEDAQRWKTIWRFQAGDKRVDGWWDLGGTFGGAVNSVIDTTRGGRDLAAKRAIVDHCKVMAAHAVPGSAMAQFCENILRNAAAPFRDHPDFDPDWRIGD